MRIISGSLKGRRIQAPKRLPVRPTTDMAKEALFNILNNQYYFDELKVLDLFAGTGNISYEFASRGTPSITCVDANFNCVKFINKTAEALELPIHTVKSDVYKYLEHCGEKFDIIFADPPYDFSIEMFGHIPELVFKHGILTDEGQLIIEHAKYTDLSSLPNFQSARSYGGSVFSFFQ